MTATAPTIRPRPQPRFLFWGLPWLDRAGRLSRLRLWAFLIVLIVPAAWASHMSYQGYLGFFGSSIPWEIVVIETGAASIWLMLATLCITPLRKMTGNNFLIGVRRMLGLAAFAYLVAHLIFYFVLRLWDVQIMIDEIIRRPTIQFALAASVPMIVLAATSTDGAIRALGRTWNRLHWLCYPATGLAVLHYITTGRAVGGPAYATAGIFAWLMGWRLLDRFGLAAKWWSMPALGAGALAFTAGFEIWTGVLKRRRYEPDFFTFDNGLPSLIGVLLFSIAAAGIAYACRRRTVGRGHATA